MKSYLNYTSFLGLIVAGSIFLTACEPLSSKLHLGPKLGIKIPLEDEPLTKETNAPKNDEQDEEEEIRFSQLDNRSEEETARPKTSENKVYPGSGRFTSKNRNTQSSTKTKERGQFSLNFDAADLGEVSKIILTDMLQENYVMSPKVAGTVTLQTTHPLHKEELLPTLEMLLRINGAVLIKRDGLYRIEPNASSTQMADASEMGKRQLKAGYQIKIIPLHYVGAIDMAEIIIPLLPNKAIIKVDSVRNILFVAGTKNEINKILDLVNTFDVNFISGMSFGLYPLENTDVTSTLSEIEQIFNKGEKTPLSGMIRFIPITHLNAILVVTQQKAYLKEVEKWITRLDQESEAVGEGGLIVYRVQHVDAVELAATLSEIISGSASSSTKKPSVAPGQKISSISNKKRKVQKNTANRKSSGKGNASLEGVNVIADEPNNALVIMAQPQQYRTLKKIIKQLDVMPLQVLIDATIISVNLADNLEYGLKWIFENGIDGSHDGVGMLGLARDAALGAATNGFSYSILNNSDKVRILFNALANDNKIDVISTPSLMVLNNHEATIKVGDQVPRQSSLASTNENGGLVPAQIELRDTGVILTVKPRVNANGIVIMDIDQKVDTVAAIPVTASATEKLNPTILQRQIKSSVAIASGESVVLGGLISETHTNTKNGIPLLKDLPFFGWLFGTIVKDVTKDELIVILTPRVVANKVDARKVTNEFKRKLTGIFYDKSTYKLKSNEVLRDTTGREIKNSENIN